MSKKKKPTAKDLMQDEKYNVGMIIQAEVAS